MTLRLGVALLAAALVWAVLQPARGSGELQARVAGALHATGADHPVTAVLLGFRAYDTLLETAVLLLAVLAATAASGEAVARAAPATPSDPVLKALVNALVPVMAIVAVYLLWAGTKQPGGAFQAGAVLGAAGVLLRLAGELPLLDPDRPALRVGLAAGLAVFLAAFAADVLAGTLLLVEVALTVSIGLTLACLFAAARR
jgi:multisubunit Na+/H+ antiporter MnhB subunit